MALRKQVDGALPKNNKCGDTHQAESRPTTVNLKAALPQKRNRKHKRFIACKPIIGTGPSGPEDTEVRFHSTKLLIRNVKNISKEDVEKFFSKFGSITYIEQFPRSNTALINFDSELVASTVLNAPITELAWNSERHFVVEQRRLPKRGSFPIIPVVEVGVVDYTFNTDVTSIHDLPDELLKYIFTFLTPKERIRTELVCKYWRSIGRKEPWGSPSQLSLSAEENPDYNTLTKGIIESILSRCGGTIKHLSVLGLSDSNVVAVNTISQFCPNLVDIKLVSIPVSNQDLQLLAANCKKTRRLTLHQSKLTSFTEDALSQYFDHCKELESVDISNNYLPGECFASLGKKVTTLCVDECGGLCEVANLLTAKCDQLQVLKLPNCNSVKADVLLQIIHRYRKTLRVLHLDANVMGINWCLALQEMPNMEDLNLDQCYKVDDEVLSVLVKACPKLRVLNINSTSITDKGLGILASCACLESLDISNNNILGTGIEALASQGKLKEVISWSNTSVTKPNKMYCPLAELCPNLSLLDISDAPRVSNLLVNSFRISIEKGVLKGPIKLIVGATSVNKNARTCNGLELVFKNSSQLFKYVNDGHVLCF